MSVQVASGIFFTSSGRPRNSRRTERNEASSPEIDALGAQVDPARLAASMRTFDALQRSSRRIAPMNVPRSKPRAFTTFAQKNAWERKEETRLARRAQAPAAGKR